MFSGTAWSMWRCSIAISHSGTLDWSVLERQGYRSGQPPYKRANMEHNMQRVGFPMTFPRCSHWHYYALAQVLLGRYQREGVDFLGRKLGSLIRTKLKTPIKWMEASRFSSSKESAPYTMCCEGDVWNWIGKTGPRCTSMADGKCCLLQQGHAALPSDSAQEKKTTLGGTELYRSSW